MGVPHWLAFFTCPDPSLHSSGPYSSAMPPTQYHPATSNATCPLQQVMLRAKDPKVRRAWVCMIVAGLVLQGITGG